MVRLTVVYDNDVYREGMRSDWGFSCLIETDERTILFDTGANGDILLGNMEQLHIDPAQLDLVFLSHDHMDHTGGLRRLQEIVPKIEVYQPNFASRPKEFRPGLITTGLLSNIEQSLILRRGSEDALIVIVGCSHPGLRTILDAAREYGPIDTVIGGFHGFNHLEALQDVGLVVPCHCTQQKQKILDLYPESSIACGAGRVIER